MGVGSHFHRMNWTSILACGLALALAACTKKSEVPAPANVAVLPDASGPKPGMSSPTACIYEENCDCPAPGIPVRWALSYCMSKIGTDDCETAMACLDEAEKSAEKDLAGKSDCEKNQYWADRICREAVPPKECSKQIPAVVSRGC